MPEWAVPGPAQVPQDSHKVEGDTMNRRLLVSLPGDEIKGMKLEVKCSGVVLGEWEGTLTPEVVATSLTFTAFTGELKKVTGPLKRPLLKAGSSRAK